MTSLPMIVSPPVQRNCWNRIGVTGDRSCPELANVIHCHNCSVFAEAGRAFFDAAPPPGYLEEWTRRLASGEEEEPRSGSGSLSLLVFRLAEEWLALPVAVMVEVALPRPVHRIPHRQGLLAGLVNVRGELLLCVYLAQLLGVRESEDGEAAERKKRLLVVKQEAERWVFPVDEVDQVQRFDPAAMTDAPVTAARAAQRLTRGVFSWQGRSVGCLDEERLFQVLRARVR